MKKIHLFITSLIILTSCQGFSDAGKVLRNEKIKTTDEFLIKKRNPLELPPDYEKIPEPGSISKNKINEEEKIKEILKAPKTKDVSNNNNSSIEKSILNEIRK
mgnify:CR=1 FL=1|tara:strand:- start:3474 stop:3782 length:309 start_codon:yes stop_codon:yes gene_type:complete